MVLMVNTSIKYMVKMMNMHLKMTGFAEQIMQGAVKYGLAKTKTDALMLGLVALDHKYKILERMEDEEDVRESDRIMEEVRTGKQKLYSLEQFEKMTGLKIGKRKK